MSLNNKRVFLAGSSGMAGISVLRHILDNFPDAKIRACYHVKKPVIRNRRIEYVRGDLRSLDVCRRMVKGCDYAIAAAGYTGGANFVRTFPWEHMRENLMINLQLLEAVRLEKVRRAVIVGSTALYQAFDGPIKEEEIDLNADPHDVYFGFGWGARFVEKLSEFLNKQYGSEVIIARTANIFGPYDRFDSAVSNFIPAIIRKAVERMDPFEVWGSPEVTRDVVYSEDFARAIVSMADNDTIKFGIFNVGSGARTKVNDVVEWALKCSGHRPSEIRYAQDKPTTIKFRALDCAKIKKCMGWEPRYTVEEGIKETTQWWIKNKERWAR